MSIFITTNYFIITESFFSWMLTKKFCKDRQLDILAAHKLEKLENMVSNIYKIDTIQGKIVIFSRLGSVLSTLEKGIKIKTRPL